MFFRLRNLHGSTWLRRNSSVSFAISPSSIGNFSNASKALPETLESSSLIEAGRSERSDFDAILSIVGDRGNEDEVFHRLAHDKACDTIKLSESLVQKLLLRFKDDWKSAVGVLKWAESCRGYKHSSDAYDTVVDILGKAKKWDRMIELVYRMRKDNLVTHNTIAKVMRRLSGAGKWEDAVGMFDELSKFGLEKNTESMNILLGTLCKENKVGLARSVFLELKSHIRPNAHTFNIFIHGWCRANRVDEAHWAIQEMKGHGCCPCVISYSTIIRCYCQESNYVKVYEVLDEMEANGCPPNAVTYTTIMSSLTMHKEYESALRVAHRMKKAGCKPDTFFYNCLIHTLSRAGKLEEAIHVFRDEMPQLGVPASASTYNSMIAMFCHHNQEEKAFEILDEMESLKLCDPDAHTYHPLLKLCFKKGDMDGVRRLLDKMVNKHNISLDESTYTLLIQSLCRGNRCEWAYNLFEEMISQDLTPRYRTCRLLLEEVKQKNMDEAAERIDNIMKKGL
ncbi:PREDICTED: pentatricopeptide repeat-containing protein At3g04130, mitochondrial [Tarenaya hassleriana]|uniref:pentatricopeptide repeat-containing protein At3g04130, mitochondrial n=1 Tax=Tarenaya hassleriana TaxID=28532 RepID=UPI00053C22AB|nr:PREDICTED: pentatricopeptide repeat-containing protein At3g04130, mitochondrial [Tarenaya hassleriana]